MRHLISRPSRFLPFAALAACGFFGDGRRALCLLWTLALSRGLSLSAGMAFRAAAGGIVHPARLRGNFLLSLALTLTGGAAAALLGTLIGAANPWLCLSGALLSADLIFSDRLHVSADGISAPLLDFLTGLLAAAGLLLSRQDDRLLCAATGLASAVGLIVCLVNTRPLSVRAGWKILTKIPRGLLRGWLLPGILGLTAFLSVRDIPVFGYSMHVTWNDWNVAALCLAALWGLNEVFASPFRRSESEGDFCVIFWGLLALAVTAASLFLTEYADARTACRIALPVCVVTLLLECPLNLKTAVMALLLMFSAFAGSLFPARQSVLMWVSLALAAAAAALTIPAFAGIRRRRRAVKLRKSRVNLKGE